MEAGKSLNVRAGCPNLIERIEGGLLSYGNDMTYENNPFECGLDKFCNLDAPIEFFGRDALQAVHDNGPDRLIKGIRMDGDPVPACVETWPVAAAGAHAGMVTSAALFARPRHQCRVRHAGTRPLGCRAPGRRRDPGRHPARNGCRHTVCLGRFPSFFQHRP